MATAGDLSNLSLAYFVDQAASALTDDRLELAHAFCLVGITHFPESAKLLTLLGWIYARSSDFANAETTFRHALCYDTTDADTHAGLAAVLARAGRFADAEPHYRRALDLCPHSPNTFFNYGCTLTSLNRPDEAVDAFRKAIELNPLLADAHLNLASALGQLGQWKESLASCRRASEHCPSSWQARLIGAMAQLAMGSFAAGWDDYEARAESQSYYTRLLELPEWQGPADHRESIAVVPEQGIGTQIMFASCLNDLEVHVRHCMLGCDPRLIALFRRSFPTIDIVAGGALPELARNERLEAYTMAGSLPRWFRRSRKEFSGDSYLVADAQLGERWKRRLEALGPGLKIGISWRGGSAALDTKHRATDPHDWLPIAGLPDVQWVNLQYDATSAEVACWNQMTQDRFCVVGDADLKVDFENLAALVSQLDLVVSAVNSTVHLAGALGTPTWTLVPVGGEWRWQSDGEECLWHHSASIFRQQRRNDWTDCFAKIRTRLSSKLRHRPPKTPWGDNMRAAG